MVSWGQKNPCNRKIAGNIFKWLLNQEAVDSVIVGASKFDHIVQNIALASAKKPIPREAMEKCDAVWDTIHGSWFSYHAYDKPPVFPKK